MTAPTDPHAAAAHDEHEEHIHPVSYYVKTWALLVVLLAVSFVGPIIAPHIFGPESIGKTTMVLTTAFGIAIVKCFLVCAYFMHLNIEKRLASMIVLLAVVLMGLFFSGVSPDVMKHQGDQWVNLAANAETARRIEREGADGKKLDAEVERRLEEHEHGGGHAAEKSGEGAKKD